jgi:hypothetical protein
MDGVPFCSPLPVTTSPHSTACSTTWRPYQLSPLAGDSHFLECNQFESFRLRKNSFPRKALDSLQQISARVPDVVHTMDRCTCMCGSRLPRNRGSSVGTVTGYGFDIREVQVRVLAEAMRFRVQTGSRAHLASYTIGTGKW